MKNIKFFLQAVFSACLLIGALAACSSEDITKDTPQGEGKGVQFAFSLQDFEKDEQVTSRAAADNVLGRDTVDVDNNIEAEVIVKSDNTPTNTAATRATLSNGHYTVVAYQGGAVKGTLKGTWNGSAMVPDVGYKNEMQLPAGTYTFVCFNDKISMNGTKLTVSRESFGNAALLGINKDVAVSGLKQSVSFAMKHAESRIRILFDLYWYDRGFNGYVYSPKFSLSSINNTDISDVAEYDVVTDTWSKVHGAAVNENITSYYLYFLPSTNCSDLKITFTEGEIYGRNVVGKSLKLFATHNLKLESNKSYEIRIALHYKFVYLFSDGTTGTIAANPTKIPIGLVVDKETRTAVALKDATVSALWTKRSGRQNTTNYDNNRLPYYVSKTDNPELFDGYNDTWNANNSFDGITVKGTSDDFPAFKAAAEYNPGVPTAASIGKWYLPAAGELYKYLVDTLTIGRGVRWTSTAYWAFVRAGGTGMGGAYEYGIDESNYYTSGPVYDDSWKDGYNTSTEYKYDDNNLFGFALYYAQYKNGTYSYKVEEACVTRPKTQSMRVRAFVHY